MGEKENSGEEQECRKKTKKEREVKTMKKIVAMICLITLLCMSTCVAFAEETLNFEEMVTENQIARIGEKNMLDIAVCVQEQSNYCGPANLQMILKHFGISKSQSTLAKEAQTGAIGTGLGTKPGNMATCLNSNLGSKKYGYYRTKTSDQDFKTNVISSIKAGYPVACLVKTGTLPYYTSAKKNVGHWLLVKGYSLQAGATTAVNVTYNDPIDDSRFNGGSTVSYQMMVSAMGNHESDNNGYYVAQYGY